jgi:hypothetical protein
VDAADLRHRDDGDGFEVPKGTSSGQSNFQDSQDQSAISVAVVNARRTSELQLHAEHGWFGIASDNCYGRMGLIIDECTSQPG